MQSNRSTCPACGRRSVFYCPFPGCLCLLPPQNTLIPRIRLPLHLHIAHHQQEKLTKSTAVHAVVLAPEDTTFYYGGPRREFVKPVPLLDASDTVALFPSPDAILLSEMPIDQLKKLVNVVLVDGTWSKASAAVRRANIGHLRCVRLSKHHTRYWRRQKRHAEKEVTWLSSIEAVYYFYREFIEALGEEYQGQFDGLLQFFEAQHELIETFTPHKLH